MAGGTLSILNPTPTRLPGCSLLHHLVRDSVPNAAVALEHTSADGTCERLTYDQLHQRSDALATVLLRGDTTRSPQLYISQLAILKAGGAFCPIPLDVPEERLRFILQDVEASILLTVSGQSRTLPVLGNVEAVEVDRQSLESVDGRPQLAIEPSDAAYVMYTSGSTGTPKGVILSHSAATQALLAHDRHIPTISRFLQFANPTFDVSVFEIFFPLYRGATLVSCDRRRLLNDLPGVLNALNVDGAELTPSVANSLLHDRKSVPSLKLLLTIGEMLKKSVVEEFGAPSESESILWGMYGPTEATIHCTLQSAFTTDLAVNDIGLPLDTVSAFVVAPAKEDDPGHAPEILPLNEEGELAVGGYQLADGYLNRPEQTKAAFVRHPEHGLLYRTGDRARMTAEGRLLCLGRISSGQVKLRGQRIELGEIEYAAARTPGCKTVVADVLDGTLVAFCVRSNMSVTVDDIRRTCRKWLPAFMVPADVLMLDSLPYLASAKVDRKALAAQYAEARRFSATDNQSSVGHVARTMSDTLGVSLQDDTPLASIGLDSLSAIRVATQLRRLGFSGLDANTLLVARSAADIENSFAQDPDSTWGQAKFNQMPEAWHEMLQAALAHPLIADRQTQVEKVYPCTPVQVAMLVETAKDPKAYCNWVLLQVYGCRDQHKVRHALEQLSARHELLRSGFLRPEETPTDPLVVVWRHPQSDSIRLVDDVNTAFSISSALDALSTPSFELSLSPDGVNILLKLHHALYDQWSIDVLKADLAILVEGHQLEPRPAFTPISVFYDSHLRSPSMTDSEDFWLEYLQDFVATPVPNLCGRLLPNALARTSWRETRCDIASLRHNANEQGFSVPAVFQAAFSWLLSMYSGSPDVIFGTVFSGRHVPLDDVEYIFGPCLCTLPSRTDISGVRTCLDLIRLVHERNRAMQRHALLPLGHIKRVCGCESDTPLFDSLFVWQESTISNDKQADLVKELDSADNHEFNLVIEYQPTESGIRVRATYQTSVLPPKQVDLMLDQLNALVSHVSRHLDAPTSSMASAFETGLLSIANPNPKPRAAGNDIVELIERQAIDRPDTPAIKFASDIDSNGARMVTISFSDLNRRANQLAHLLQSHNVLPNDLVCVCMEKSIDMYTAFVAALKAGAGYLPLTPDTPQSRVKNILQQAKVKICLSDRETSEMLRTITDGQVLQVGQLDLTQRSPDNLKVVTSGSDIAYTVFTSGSTGEPKGVAVTRNNLAGNLAVLSDLYNVHPGDRLLQACSQAFDVSVFEIFFAFTKGMCLCAAVKEVLFHDLERSIRAFEATHLSLTPTVAALVDPRNVPSVRFLVTAGEGVTEVVRRKWAGHNLHQGYGPSETTNICAVHMNMHQDDALGYIGPPLANTSAFVVSLDKDLKVLPAGAIGEYVFGGEQVFRGYLGRDDLNSAKLVAHPQYGTLYRSGDSGRILHDGTLLIAGRLDEQVKIRGNRVELGEITAMLLQDPDVVDSAALVDGKDSDTQALVAFFVPKRSEAAVTEVLPVESEIIQRLFATLQNTLPPYMVPDTIVPISKMPLTTQGKLDKGLLQRLLGTLSDKREAFSRNAGSEEGEADWTTQEIEIAAALADTLHISQNKIRKSASFFSLGLNSLNAIAFAKAAEKRIGQAVKIGAVLKHPSIARLVIALRGKDAHDAAIEATPTDDLSTFPSGLATRVKEQVGTSDGRVDRILPCTPLQEAMLSASSTPGSSAYCNSTVFQVSGDVEKLRACWATVVGRHDILRTSFVATDHAAFPYVQVVRTKPDLPWSVVTEPQSCDDLDTSPVRQPPSSFGHSQPLYLEVSRLKAHTTMTLHMHHAIYDGISMAVLLSEVEQLYHGGSLAHPPSLDAFLSQSLAQRSQLTLDYWSSRLRDFSPKPFPLDTPATRPQEGVSRRKLVVSQESLQTFCQRRSVTALAVLQAAWAKTLASVQQAPDICFGNVVSGRSVAVSDVDRLVAPCFNTIPVRANLEDCKTNEKLVNVLQRWNVESIGHQLAPLRRLQAMTKSPGHHLFDSMLLLQPPATALDQTIWSMADEVGTMDVPLVVELVPEDGSHILVLHHLQPHVSQDLVQDLSRALDSALTDILRYPSGSVDSFEDFDSSVIAGKLRTSHDANLESPNHGAEKEEWDSVESMVRQVFANLSMADISRIGKQTSMYQLGLDSLNAAQIAARLRASGLHLDATDVVECLTPSAIASRAASGPPTPNGQEAVNLHAFDQSRRPHLLRALALGDAALQAVRPCTAVQAGMIAQSLHTSGRLYVNHITHEAPAGVTYAAVRGAWAAVQRRHPILRTGFHRTDDPQHPFLMGILHVDHAQLPVEALPAQDDLSTLESSVARKIVDSLHSGAWQVSVFEHRGRTATMLSIHHACYDAESLQYLFDDFRRALSSEELEAPTSLDSLLTVALNGQTSIGKASDSFWRATLEKASFDRFPNLTAVAVRDNKMHVVERQSKISVSALEGYCSKNAATIQATGQAAWAQLLSAYIGEPNVTFGTVFSGRSGSGSQETAFPSIATIPVAVSLEGATKDLVSTMVKYNASIYRHRFTPLADIQRAAGDASNSLFDTVFVYQKQSGEDVSFDWHVLRETASVDYAVSMEVELSHAGQILLRLTVDTGRVPERHATLIVEQYEHLLTVIISESEQSLQSPDLYSIAAPKEPILPTEARFLHDFVALGAHRHPDKTALYFVQSFGKGQTRTWTYRELNERSNQVAHLLRDHGIPAGSIIAVRMDKCPEATFAFIGILKAGCSFLALDPALPEARQVFILEDSGSKALLLYGEDEGGVTRAGDAQVIRLTERALSQLPSEAISPELQDTDATCYCLYTSGTTGTPKGCEITHENAVQAMLAFQRLFAGHWDENSRWLQFASYWFDVSVLEQFWSWSVGIAVVGAPRDLVLEDLAGFIARLRITHIDLTPSLARLLDPNDVPTLHNGVFITGGEALKQEIIDAWGPVGAICNGYGPTEATIGVTMNPFVGPDAKPSNIGPPFDNVGAYVLVPGAEEPVLRGAVGELCVSGRLVGKGYLNRPELTAKAFPYLSRFHEKIYRTGDLVRLLSDGSVSFIGRKDTQAKLRGQRLEIGEIDNVIKAATDRISEVVSMVVKEADGSKEQLVSFVTGGPAQNRTGVAVESTENGKVLVSAADRACRERLPGYMVPTHIVAVNFLPLTVNNKVDGKALVALFRSMDAKLLQDLKGTSAAGKGLDETEKRVRDVLVEMLDIADDGIDGHANLFSLGLSSISAITFASLLKRGGFETAQVALVMQYPTIAGLARVLGTSSAAQQQSVDEVKQAELSINAFSQRHRTRVARKLAVSGSDIEVIAPCTPLQEGLILDSLRKEERPYFNEFRYAVGHLDLLRLQEALQAVARSAQILRAKFLETDDGFAQVVLKHSQLPWLVCEAEGTGLGRVFAEAKATWLGQNQDELVQPVVALVVKSSHEATLAIYAHHAVYDGISWQLFLDALGQAYRTGGIPDAGPSFTSALALEPLSMPNKAPEFWKERLSDFQYSPMPSRGSSHHKAATIVASRVKRMDDIDIARKKLGVSHQAYLQACFEVAVKSRFRDVQTYGQVVSGRSIALEGADKIIGPLFNTLPHTIQLDPGATWADLIESASSANASVLPYQHTPLRSIRKWCKLSPADPLFDVLFVFQYGTDPEASQLLRELEQPVHADYALSFETTLLADGQLEILAVAKDSITDIAGLEELVETFIEALGVASSTSTSVIGEAFTLPEKSVSRRAHAQTNGFADLNGVHDFEWSTQAQALREAIAQIAGIGIDSIDEHSTIFSVGLDSIDAVKLASRAKKAGVPIPVSKILQAQTIPRMLQVVQHTRDGAHVNGSQRQLAALQGRLTESVSPSLANFQVEKILPATPSQEALVAEMLKSDWHDYYNHDVLRLAAGVDVERLKKAWQSVVDRTPILRTGFMQIPDADLDFTFAQVVHQQKPLDFGVISSSDEPGLQEKLQHITEEVKDDYKGGLLLRLTFAQVEYSDYLILSLSHAQYDGHSLALLHEDVKAAYHGHPAARPPCDDLIEESLVAVNEDARSFWSSVLEGAKASRLAAVTDRASSTTTHRAEEALGVSAHAASSLCRQLGISMQALAQASWALVLAQRSHALEVIFGVVLACRDSEEAEQVIFPTMNTVPVRLTLHGTCAQMLQYTQGMMTDVRPYQKTPLRVVQALASSRASKVFDDGGLFDTLLLFQHRPASPGTATQPLYESAGGSSSIAYAVAVEMEALGDELILRTACKDSAFDQTGTKRLLEDMGAVIQCIINDPDRAAVTFSGNEARIAGLAPFTMPNEEAHDSAAPLESEIAENPPQQMSPLAVAIRGAMAKVAKTSADDISPAASIESIGIDSISAIKVIALLRKEGISLSVSELIRARNITQMAQCAEAKKQNTVEATKPSSDIVTQYLHGKQLHLGVKGLELSACEAILPATPGQIYLLSMWMKTRGQLFHPTFKYRLRGEVKPGQMREAWELLVASTPALRTVFCATGDSDVPVVQAVLKQSTARFYEGSQGTLTTCSEQPMAALSAEKHHDGYLLSLHIHHALYDAVSLGLLMQDFEALLGGRQLKDSGIRQEDYLALSITSEAQASSQSFWISYLSGVKPMSLVQPATDGVQDKVEIFKPDISTQADALEAFARQQGVTTQAVLFATYAKVYATVAPHDDQAEDVVLGIYLANRSHLPDLDQLRAPTLNLVPLVVRAASRTPILTLAQQVTTDLNDIGTAENSGVGLWQIKDWTGVTVDTFVNFLKLPERDVAGGDGETAVTIAEVDDYKTVGYARVGRAAERDAAFGVPEALEGLRREAVVHAVDVEATLAHGKLDLGLFCPLEMLGFERAERMMTELARSLEALV
ncbi:Nonribosomal peptide synthetase [Teratosphaeria destructans]|uniref:Nonribosomal peptide synthetase n=1 Tax=Teratosphaeria destructans TaxID=418781 RepID=A0A9W7W150_9PEZI|nr:Nonribosomal peptide synthetase [Teratosphaeria destructans]